MKTVLCFGRLGWSVDRVNRDIERYLNDEFRFIYYEWSTTNFPELKKIYDECDLCMTSIASVYFFQHNKPILDIDLKKCLFLSHGSCEFEFPVPNNLNYGMTSYEISHCFPNGTPVFLMRNGVEPAHFEYKERSGEINTLGWCGSPGVLTKRHEWSYQISNGVNLPLKRAETMPFSEMKDWYHTIDILLITAGPDRWVETGPLPAFEAIASGVLVIGTNVGNFTKIPGPKFSTVEEGIEIINKLKQNPEEVKRIAKIQYQCVIENWTYKDISIGWRSAFNAVLKKVAL
jgi:hypothetical protein